MTGDNVVQKFNRLQPALGLIFNCERLARQSVFLLIKHSYSGSSKIHLGS